MACGPAAGHRPVVFGTQNACDVLPLSPREERAGRESERGETDKKCLLSPALSSFLRRRGRVNAVARSKQIFCRTQPVGDRRSTPRYLDGGAIETRCSIGAPDPWLRRPAVADRRRPRLPVSIGKPAIS